MSLVFKALFTEYLNVNDLWALFILRTSKMSFQEKRSLFLDNTTEYSGGETLAVERDGDIDIASKHNIGK